MNIRMLLFLPAFALLLGACEGSAPTTTSSTPTQVRAVSATTQTGVLDEPLADSLAVLVTDARGRPVPGVTVAWSVSASGGSFSTAASTTNAAGEARTQWTIDSSVGTHIARASIAGLPPVEFTAVAGWPAPAALQIQSGDRQDGAPAGRLADSLTVLVVSARGRPVGDATVAWSVSTGNGVLSATTATTSAAGTARVAWTLGLAGPNTATASAAGIAPVTFSAYAVPVASITFSAAQPVVTRGDTLRIVPTARDSVGNPLPGRVVTWTTSAPDRVSVNASGVVTGMGRGAAVITASSEGRSASVNVTVAQRPPQLTGLAFTPNPVIIGPAGAEVEVRVSARADSGLRRLYTFLEAHRSDPPNEQRHACTNEPAVPVEGTSELGTWMCRVHLPAGSAAGTWGWLQCALTRGQRGTRDRLLGPGPRKDGAACDIPGAEP